MNNPANSEVQIDNDKVRVTRWSFDPGTETGQHKHGYDYVVVPLTSGQLQMTTPDGNVLSAELKAGVAYARQAGIEHNVVNLTDREIVFVEIEMK